jgi:uncharacterized protein (DUF488 family)
MLNRQRVLLAVIAEAHNPLKRVRLFKYAFLVGQKSECTLNFKYYDFVPYMYGPYSFSLEQELSHLQACSLVDADNAGLQITSGLLESAADAIQSLGAQVRHIVRHTVARWEGLNLDDLLRSVYSEYPEYAFNSSLRKLIPRTSLRPRPASLAIYTVGYEGQSIDSFLHKIIRSGISTILDVRANPVSRKYGFARSTLGRLSSKLGIHYMHVPELGIPSGDRKTLGSPDSYAELFARYEQEMLPRHNEALQRAASVVTSQSTVLLCRENLPHFCHRGRLAIALQRLTGLSVEHI